MGATFILYSSIWDDGLSFINPGEIATSVMSSFSNFAISSPTTSAEPEITEKPVLPTNITTAQPEPVPPPLEIPRDEAIKVLCSFHDGISRHEYTNSYACFSGNMQNAINYDKWSAGFQNTISSIPSDISVSEENADKVTLTYHLTVKDHLGVIQNFNGTSIIIKEGHGWKIDRIDNRLIEPIKMPEPQKPSTTASTPVIARDTPENAITRESPLSDKKGLTPEEALLAFYNAVTQRDYKEAYDFFHTDYKNKKKYQCISLTC